jgi:hypothetical protein
MRQLRLALILWASALSAATPFAAAAPKSVAERAKVLQQVVDCRTLSDAAERLACYDRSAEALDDAEKTGEVVVVDQAKARDIRRQSFGLSLPSLSFLNLSGKGEGVDRLETRIQTAREFVEGRFLIHTVDGATWRQLDGDNVRAPKAGQSLVITPGLLGSFFCRVDNQLGFRCKREN